MFLKVMILVIQKYVIFLTEKIVSDGPCCDAIFSLICLNKVQLTLREKKTFPKLYHGVHWGGGYLVVLISVTLCDF